MKHLHMHDKQSVMGTFRPYLVGLVGLLGSFIMFVGDLLLYGPANGQSASVYFDTIGECFAK